MTWIIITAIALFCIFWIVVTISAVRIFTRAEPVSMPAIVDRRKGGERRTFTIEHGRRKDDKQDA